MTWHELHACMRAWVHSMYVCAGVVLQVHAHVCARGVHTSRCIHPIIVTQCAVSIGGRRAAIPIAHLHLGECKDDASVVYGWLATKLGRID